jgi:very-short-patch-repair endonuclease
MPLHSIVTGQSIDPVKLQRAQELREQMTLAERRLWEKLRANRLGGFHFRRQQIIDGFIVDFYCHAADLVVELDGSVHRTQVDYDTERDRLLAQRGLAVMRIANERVADALEAVLAEILQACRQRTPAPR